MSADETPIDIRSLPTMKDVFDHIMKLYPDWMVNTCDKYSDDYPKLTENWIELSKLSKTSPQKIILVKDFSNDEQLSYAELLYSAGFLVRTIQEFIPCSKCQCALPTKMTYEKLQKLNMRDIPDVWSITCRNCQV
jgi:hypothetical protein